MEKTMNMMEKPWKNHGKNHENDGKNHGKTMKMMEKPWKNIINMKVSSWENVNL